MKKTGHVLLFHVDKQKTKEIKKICQKLNLQTTEISPSSYHEKLGYLAGIDGFKKENKTYIGPDFPSEMLLFSGMDSDLVDQFLAAYKMTTLAPIGLKAILTMHNIFWTATELYQELSKEHAMFH